MIRNELFFHYQTPYGRSLDFSVLMKQDANDPMGVWLSATICNKQDKVFSKKIARQVLRERPLQAFRLRELPSILGELHLRVLNGGFSVPSKEDLKSVAQQYDFILRKFL